MALPFDRYLNWSSIEIQTQLRGSVYEQASGSFKKNLELLLQQMKWIKHTLTEYDTQTDELAKTEKYKESCATNVAQLHFGVAGSS